MILDDFNHKPGKSCRTVALRDLMARRGMACSEDFVFGLSEGLAFSFVKPNKAVESDYFKCLAPNLFQFDNFAKNVGMEYQVRTKETDDLSYIEDILTYEDAPVFCEISPSKYKKYLASDAAFWKELKMDVPINTHITEVIGIDSNNVYICENYSKEVYRIPRRVFVKARNSRQDSYLNPHQKVHYFIIPERMQDLDFAETIRKAIRNNMITYMDTSNPHLGKRAFDLFISELPNLYKEHGERVCGKSLYITGNLIKFVSPGMFRKMYSRFLQESKTFIGYEQELDGISSLLNQADYLWNKYASHILKNDCSVEERMNGKISNELLQKINNCENEFVERLSELSMTW